MQISNLKIDNMRVRIPPSAGLLSSSFLVIAWLDSFLVVLKLDDSQKEFNDYVIFKRLLENVNQIFMEFSASHNVYDNKSRSINNSNK